VSKEESVMEKQLPRKPATFETVWASLQELAEAQKETDRLIKENARKADRRIEETYQQIKETYQEMKETDRRMKQLQGTFDNQWGAFMESLVEGDLVAMLQDRGIPVQKTRSRRLGRINRLNDGKNYEYDILAINGEQVVVVEVKTTLHPEGVRDFLEDLAEFTTCFPDYKGKVIHGAMAYLKADESVQQHVIRQGLFAIRATGDSASIVNDEGFVPRVFE